jgi:hypothetical protein
MLIRALEAACDQFQGSWPWPADNDWHTARILGACGTQALR